MAVQNLHEAAVVLEGALVALNRLMDETEPMEREYHQRKEILLRRDDTQQETIDRLAQESGFHAFYNVACEIRDLLGALDEVSIEESRRASGVAS